VELWEYHPALVHFPIAFLIGAVLLDLYAWRRGDPASDRVATGLLLAGVATAALAAAAGVLAFYTGPASHTEESGKLIWWHIGAAVTQFLLFAIVAVVRWRSQPAPQPTWTRLVGLIAALVLLFAGYEGGYIVYHGGSGVEPNLLAPELRERQEKKQSGSSGQSRLETETEAAAAIAKVCPLGGRALRMAASGTFSSTACEQRL
jgi:uncharacterized membrane protein